MKKVLGILAVGLVIALVISLCFWLHHMFVTGLLLLLPVVIKLWGWARRQWSMNARYMPAILFLYACMAWLISRIFIGDMKGTFDVMFHDTYFVIANVHILFGISMLLGFMALTYFTFSDAFESRALRVMGLVHFWITFIGVYLFFSPDVHFIRHDEPRRYLDYSGFVDVNTDKFFTPTFILIIVLAQVMFVGVVVYAAGQRLFLRRSGNIRPTKK